MAENPQHVGGAKWNRELAALSGLYAWATRTGNAFVAVNPVETRSVLLPRSGAVASVPVQRAKDSRSSNVHWLTTRTFRRWVDVGRRGLTRDGLPAPGWRGRLESRNVAHARLLYGSGLRRSEGASLLTFEVPELRLQGGRYLVGRIAAAVTRSKKPCTYYVPAEVVGQIDSYVESARARAVRAAQAVGRYDRIVEMRLVLRVSGGPRRVAHWCDRRGVLRQTEINAASVYERMTFYTEGSGARSRCGCG